MRSINFTSLFYCPVFGQRLTICLFVRNNLVITIDYNVNSDKRQKIEGGGYIIFDSLFVFTFY